MAVSVQPVKLLPLLSLIPPLFFLCPVPGVHRQVLVTSLGFYLGYYLCKRANYEYALKDRQLSEYIRHHPEDFKEKGTFVISCWVCASVAPMDI